MNKAYTIGTQLFIGQILPGSGFTLGERVQINSVMNQGTKKFPAYRYYVRGYLSAGFVSHEDLTTEDPTPDAWR